ncbi:MAG: Ig-like domain-containing protein [Oscillospiraceae bacterium]
MKFLPNTVCGRCHREYPSVRGRCPYCGTKKPKEVRRTMPESDSAVRGTEAARKAAEDMNWQMLIGGILLVCVIAAVITIVSVNVNKRVGDVKPSTAEENIVDVTVETTPVPPPTPTPTPSPTPTPAITSISITCSGRDMSDGFTEGKGSTVQLEATAYPLMESTVITWSSSDDSIATVDDTGLVTVVGESGQYCYVYASVGSVQAECQVIVR